MSVRYDHVKQSSAKTHLLFRCLISVSSTKQIVLRLLWHKILSLSLPFDYGPTMQMLPDHFTTGSGHYSHLGLPRRLTASTEDAVSTCWSLLTPQQLSDHCTYHPTGKPSGSLSVLTAPKHRTPSLLLSSTPALASFNTLEFASMY